jgi:hypothetical protein
MPPEPSDSQSIPAVPSLKDTLYSELGTQFTQLLEQETSLPTETKSALVSLLHNADAGSGEILAALALSETTDKEVQGE